MESLESAWATAATKAGWGDGPWQSEPDRVEFEHAGLTCLLLRNGAGVWCGYVGLPPGHRYYKAERRDVPVSVHGGLTYASECDGDICHKPKPGDPENVWWFGFDCGHGGRDLIPMFAAMFKLWDDFLPAPNMAILGTYRTLEFARAQAEGLAEQFQMKPTICALCNKNEIDGQVFILRLRTKGPEKLRQLGQVCRGCEESVTAAVRALEDPVKALHDDRCRLCGGSEDAGVFLVYLRELAMPEEVRGLTKICRACEDRVAAALEGLEKKVRVEQ